MMCLPHRMMTVALVFEPTRRHGHCTVTRENCVDLCHVGVADIPAEGSQVLGHLGGCPETDQRGAADRVAQRPAQRKLRQALAVLYRQALQFLDRSEVARKMLGAEQGSEQV